MTTERWIVIPEGTRNRLPADYLKTARGLTEINDQLPIAPQLLTIPENLQITVLAPRSLPNTVRDEFLTTVNTCWMGIQQSRITLKSNFETWLHCAFENYSRMRMAIPINRIRRLEGCDTAIIVGNGPSLQRTLDDLKNLRYENAAIFCCWHALHKLKRKRIDATYVGHCDKSVPSFDFEMVYPTATHSVIVAPTAVADFLAKSESKYVYGYIPADMPFLYPFQELLSCPLHRPIVSTVASLLLNSAIYAGYRKIVLMGVDFSWPIGDVPHPNSNDGEVKRVRNKQGRQIETCRAWEAAAQGLEATFRTVPDLVVIQSSPDALDLDRVNYFPLEEIFPARDSD